MIEIDIIDAIDTAYNCSAEGLEANGSYSGCQKCFDVNMSSLYTKLIQDTGRFTENNSSSLLYCIDKIDKAVKYPDTEKDMLLEGETLIVAIGENSVDDAETFIDNLNKWYTADDIPKNAPAYVSDYYRRVYAIKVHLSGENTYDAHMRVEMRDIRKAISNDITDLRKKRDRR